MPKDYKSPPSDDDLIAWANRMASEEEDVANLADRQSWIDFVTSKLTLDYGGVTDKQVYWLDWARDLINAETVEAGARVEQITRGFGTQTVYRDLETGRFISREDYFDILKSMFD